MKKSQPDVNGRSFAALVPSSLGSLPTVRRYMANLADVVHFDERETYDLKVAVSEAVANAVEHGAPGKAVHINAQINDDRLTVVVTNEGALAKRGRDGSRRLRGYGFTLMSALADEIRLIGTHRSTKVTLVFLLPASPKSPPTGIPSAAYVTIGLCEPGLNA